MNESAFLATTGRDSLAEGQKGGSSMFARTFTIEGRREQLDEFARTGQEKILPALRAGGFMDAFVDKDPMMDWLRTLPVTVILNPGAGLLGAAVKALTL